MDDGPQIQPPPAVDPISRPSSTSTSASAALQQLPGASSLSANNGASNGATDSPQMRATNAPAPIVYTGASPAATSGGHGSNLPTCQNCTTSTTPLWRRDEMGAVLCNACGLFLKLHGRARPISLKTDVIKSRNRVKTMRPDLVPKKKVSSLSFYDLLEDYLTSAWWQQQQQQQGFPDHNGNDMSSQSAAAIQAAQAMRRASQKSTNGNNEGVDSPVSRTGTPSMYNHGIPAFMVDDPYQTTGFNGTGVSDGHAGSPMNGDRNSDTPQTHEQLIAQNSSLKTRVSELEVINELFRGRLSQLEQQEAAARRGQEVASGEQTQLQSQLQATQDHESQLRAQLEDSHRRENNLKRRLDDLELELTEAKHVKEETAETESERPAKKPRLNDEPVTSEDAATPVSSA